MSSLLGGKKEREGEAGHHAAEQTRDAINQVRDAGEDARKNVNAFSDNLIGGNKEHGGTDIHPHAQRVRDEFRDAGDAARDKANEVYDKTDKNKRNQKKSSWFGGSSASKSGESGGWFGSNKEKKEGKSGWFGSSADKK